MKTEQELKTLSVEDLILEVLAIQESDAKNAKLAQDNANYLSEAQAKITELETKNAELTEENQKLSKQKSPMIKETFKNGDDEYEIVGPVVIPNKGRMTPLEIANSPEAQGYLIEIGSGMIRKLA